MKVQQHGWLVMKEMAGVVLFALLLLAAALAPAQEPVAELDSWDEAGVGSWIGGTAQATLSNPGGYMALGFKAQAAPSLVAVTLRRPVAGILVTNLSFRMNATEAPSSMWLCFHSSLSETIWYFIVTPPSAGNWTTTNVPLNYDAGWTMGPLRNRQQFERDMLAVDWVGVYVRRSGSCAAHSVMIDDFLVEGLHVPDSVNLAGIVTYAGEQMGPIRLAAVPVSAGQAQAGTIPVPGEFALPGVTPLTEYRIAAYRDSNSNTVQDVWEAAGNGIPDPAASGLSGVTGIVVNLNDPLGPDNLPLWWIALYFGLPDSGGGTVGAVTSWADGDQDGDGALNYVEYVAGTDPMSPESALVVGVATTNQIVAPDEVVLEWPSVAGRSYSVWRTTDLMVRFVKIASNIPATVPVNRYVDHDAEMASPYFYRIEVTHP